MLKEKIFSLSVAIFLLASFIPSINFAEGNGSTELKTYLNSNSRVGIYPSFYPGNETAQWDCMPDEAVSRLHLKRIYGSTSNRTPYFEFEIKNIDKNIQSYAYEINIYPVKHTGVNNNWVSLFNASGETGGETKYITPLKINNSKLEYDGTVISEVAVGKWTSLACIVDLVNQNFDIYVNDELKVENIALPYNFVPEKVRIALNWGNTETEYYFDNIKLYEGNVLRELDPFVSRAENKSDVASILGTSSVFSKEKDSIYINGTKTNYRAVDCDRYIKNKNLYVSYDTAKQAIGCDDSALSPYCEEKNGVRYIPIREAAEQLGKYVYEDSRGWICVSDNTLLLSNSLDSTLAEEKSDIIDRFMHFDRPNGDEIFELLKENINGAHPRIFVNSDDVLALKNDINTNSFKRTGAVEVIRQADEIVRQAVVAYEKPDGLRLFIPCLTVRNNIITLTTAYMIAEDPEKKEAYFNRIWLEIENVCCTWQDWNVTHHYLDSGKLSVGIALAYDVCYDRLGRDKREIIRNAVLDKLFYFACATYSGGTSQYGISKSTNNWGAVCNGGFLMLCLATMDDPDASDEYTAISKYISAEALQALEYSIGSTFPDGAWHEGLGYFLYVTEYLSWSANALKLSCGSDFGIMSYPGVAQMPRYALYIQTINNGYFNYSDGATSVYTNSLPPEIFLMAKLLDNSELNDMWFDFKFNLMDEGVNNSRFARDLIFYTPGASSSVHYAYPLDSKFGNVEISVMKSGWEANDAYFASVGGSVSSHFDKGSFIFDALGERWAIDLGQDNYNIEGGYVGLAGATIYRKRAEGHNTLVFNPNEDAGQIFGQAARISNKAYGENEAYTIYDLSDVYAENCSKAFRGFFLGDNRETLLIQDEFSLKNPSSEVYWFMHTKAEIQVEDNDTVTLSQNGKSVKIDFQSNLESFSLEKMDAVPLPTTPPRPGQGSNDDITKICFKGIGSGDCYIAAKLSPVIEGEDFEQISYNPLSNWSINEYSPEIFDVNINRNGSFLSASILARSLSEKSFKAIAAFYKNNKLVSLEVAVINADFEKSLNIFDNIKINPDANCVKFMFWEDYKTIRPLISLQPLNL